MIAGRSAPERHPGSPTLPRTIARNAGLNVITQLVQVAMAVASIPYIVHGLTKDGFGLLSLVWAFVGYFSLLDFGVSRANTKFLAEAISRGDDDEIRSLTWISLSLTAIIGAGSCLLLYGIAPWLVRDVLKIELAYQSLALAALRYAAFSIPFLLMFGALRGIQMAFQRFDLVNIFQGILGLIQWGGSVLLIYYGYGLREIIILTIGIRVVLCIAAFVASVRLIPDFFSRVIFWDGIIVRKVFRFGGWVTVSQVFGLLLLYLDRFFIGRMLSLAAVTIYSVPQEALTRVLIVPMSLTTTLFPAMSEQLLLPPEASKAGQFYARSIKYLSAVMFPTVIVLILLAQPILHTWMGKDFDGQATLVFQILAVGLFFNALAQIPVTVLHAKGHPRLTAIFHLVEFPVMIVVAALLIPIIGIVGAALAWSIRVTLDAALLFAGARQRAGDYVRPFADARFFRRIALEGCAAILLVIILSMTVLPVGVQLAASGAFCLGYAWWSWFRDFDESDRKFLAARLKLIGVRS